MFFYAIGEYISMFQVILFQVRGRCWQWTSNISSSTYKKATRKDPCTRLPQWAGLQTDSSICNIIVGIDSCPRINCLRCTYTVGWGSLLLGRRTFIYVHCVYSSRLPGSSAAPSGSSWQLGDVMTSRATSVVQPSICHQNPRWPDISNYRIYQS